MVASFGFQCGWRIPRFLQFGGSISFIYFTVTGVSGWVPMISFFHFISLASSGVGLITAAGGYLLFARSYLTYLRFKFNPPVRVVGGNPT